jgi:hypothetical protein
MAFGRSAAALYTATMHAASHTFRQWSPLVMIVGGTLTWCLEAEGKRRNGQAPSVSSGPPSRHPATCRG